MSEVHEHWEELAAGHALSALEPEEEAAFLAHLATCESCPEVLADHALVAARLGALVNDQDQAPSWERIRAGILPATPRADAAEDVVHGTTPAPVTSLDEVRARRRAPRLLSAAAAAVLVTGAGAIWVASSDKDQQSPQQATLAACAASPGCHVVDLQGKASLVVSDGSVRLLSSSLSAPGAGKAYVLWQLPRGGDMTLIGSLRATEPGTVGEAHQLALPYDRTAGFGLSLEPAGVVPTRPGQVVAVSSE